jgi:hypothetical protein
MASLRYVCAIGISLIPAMLLNYAIVALGRQQ